MSLIPSKRARYNIGLTMMTLPITLMSAGCVFMFVGWLARATSADAVIVLIFVSLFASIFFGRGLIKRNRQ